jgi:hypothetical protein
MDLSEGIMLDQRLLKFQRETLTSRATLAGSEDRLAERWHRRLVRFIFIVAISIVGAAGPSAAEPQPWNGTLTFEIGALEPVVITGSGVATVNSSGGGNHLTTLRLAGGISGSGVVPVTDPDATIPRDPFGGLSSVRITATLGTGTFVKDPTTSADLTSGMAGSTLLDQSFNGETRGISVTVNTAEHRRVTSMTLRTLDTVANPTTVGARIYTSGGLLMASSDTVVGAGTQPPITIPISVILMAGASYRLAFYSSSGQADLFVPMVLPYIEDSGTFVVNGGYLTSGDAFPNSNSGTFPMIEVVTTSQPPTGAGLIPVRGLLRMCIYQGVWCQDLDLTRNSGATGVGVGGTVETGVVAYTPFGISLQAAPWTLSRGAAVNQTVSSGFRTLTRTGFAHDPASGTGSTAQTSGVIQLITPMQIGTENYPPGYEKLAMFGTLTIQFIPEPSYLLLLGSGVMGLVLIGGRRMRK